MASEDLVHRFFKNNLRIMKVLGLYPFDSWPEIYKIYAYIIYFLFTIPAPLLPLINLIVVREKDIEKISDSAFLIIQIGILIIKLLPFKNNAKGVKRTVFTLNSKIFNNYLTQQNYIIDDIIKYYKGVCYIYVLLSVASLGTWTSKVFFYEDRRFPIDIWVPFEPFEDIKVYLSVFLFLFISVANAPLGNAALDTLIAGLIYHAAGQIRILKDSLQYLGQRAEEQVSKESEMTCVEEREKLKASIIYKKICECVDHYDAIFEFVKDLEETYSSVVFSQFVASIIVICISCLQLSIVEPFTITFFAMIAYLMTMLMEIYLYCYYGTILYEESNTIITAIYLSEWYNYDEKSKKALIILMERAKRPMMLTAGKLLDLSLETFTTIIRRSYSLLAVLKNY